MNPITQSTSGFLETGVNPDLKTIVWSILIGALVAFIIFFVLTRKSKQAVIVKKPKPLFKLIFTVIFFVGVAGTGLYFILLQEQNPDKSVAVLFPSTGLDTAPEVLGVSFKSLYTTPVDGLITFSLLISTIFLAVVVFRNIAIRKRIEKNLENEKITSRNVYEDLQVKVEKLAEAKAKDEALLECVGEGLIAVDNDGKIMFINKIAIDMLGWEMKELIGKVITELPLQDEMGNPIPLNRRPTTLALDTGKITKVAYFFVRKDKTRFPIAITATPIKLRGNTLGLIEIIRDITREKEIDKAKTEFVSLASHQLRTPLTTISWYTEMILKGDVGKVVPSQKKYLEEIYQGNQRMIELVNTLLDVSRIEQGTFIIESKPTDIIALAESVLNEQKPRIKKKKFTIIKNFSSDVPTFSTDPKLLRIVFQNILTNSLEYSPPGGRIEFAISFDNKKTILIKVSDTGYGIPKNQQDQIFTKLFRADNVREKDSDGTGLGLYIVKSIVENAGGKIWFESQENQGTTFYVALPLDGAKVRPESDSDARSEKDVK